MRDIAVRHLGQTRAGADDYVLTRTSARVGAHITQTELSRDQQSLLDSGLFADARILLEPLDDGVRIIYEVRHRLRFMPPARIDGNRRLGKAKIRDLLKLAEGDLIDEALLAERCDAIRAAYRDRHYPDSEITAHILPLQDGFATVTLSISEGAHQRVSTYKFNGNHSIDYSTLRAAVKQPARFNPFKRFYREWRRLAADAEAVKDAVRLVYLDEGYLDVALEVSETVSDGGRIVEVSIVEGPRYTLGGVSVAGATKFPRAELERLAGQALAPGDPAGRRRIQDASRLLRERYGSDGYVDTRVRAYTPLAAGSVSNAPIVDIRFDIIEGPRAWVNSIAIRGNTRTKDKVIRREIGLLPGDVLNEVQAENSRLRLENLGYFERVQMDQVPVRGNEARRDIVYEVAEKNTGQLMVGAGFSSVDKIIGFATVSQANFDLFNWPYFHGGGQKLNLSLEAGSETRNIEFSLTEPWFMDRRMSLTGEAYLRQRLYNEYDVQRLGGGAGLTLPLKYGRINFRYNLEKVSLKNIQPGDFHYLDDPERVYRFTDEDDSYLNAPFRATWLYDSRNRAFVPTKGTRGSVFGEVSGPFTGSDNRVYRLGAETRTWIPLWLGHVLSLSARGESVDTYGNQDQVKIGDRLFLGGGRTVRGFRYRDIGTKVLPDEGTSGRRYHPVGGLSMAMASAEYTIPIAKVLRLAAFYDVGGVWSDSFDVDLDSLAHSTGMGIRFDFPGFPIRIDYAKPLRYDDDYTRGERFVLWIGFE